MARDLVYRKPLGRRAHPARQAHADHEGECLLHLLAGALAPEVTVVLQVHTVEFDELGVILGDGAGDSFSHSIGKRPAEIGARLFDALVARQLPVHGPYSEHGQYTSCR